MAVDEGLSKKRIDQTKWQRRQHYLEEEDDVPDETQDDGGVTTGDISRINADQLYLRTQKFHRYQQNSHSSSSVIADLRWYTRFSPRGMTRLWQCC